MSTDSKTIRLRKLEENEILGPMTWPELKVLADTAFVSPGDEISFVGDHWVKAKTIADLEMFWRIVSKDGTEYGPTTLGTVREFFSAGEVDKDTRLVHTITNKETTAEEALGKEVIAQLEKEKIIEPAETLDIDFEASLEVAKDIRIRMLEVDHAALKKEFDDLSLKYRRAVEELLAIKKA